VEDAVRALVNRGSQGGVGVRFVILDLALVGGVDMSAAEAFVRIQRLCSARGIVLCFAGASGDGDHPADGGGEHGRGQVQSAVEGVPSAEVFGDVNGAMEWAENVWLREWYDAQKEMAGAEAIVLPGREPLVPQHLADVGATPRRTLVHDVGRRTIGHQPVFGQAVNEVVSPARAVAPEHAEALSALQRALSAYGPKAFDGAYFAPLLTRLERLVLPAGTVLFAQGDQPDDGLYILAAGVLRATYAFPHGGMKNGAGDVVEAMVPGAIAGELSALAGEPRNATVSVDMEAVVWRLSAGAMGELKEREPSIWEAFVRMVLKCTWSYLRMGWTGADM
jgi:SulP family sulfate permease